MLLQRHYDALFFFFVLHSLVHDKLLARLDTRILFWFLFFFREAIECEHRWRYLRDRFTRERKRKSQQSGASSGKSNGAWPLASHMHFIQDFIKHRR